MLNEKIKYHGRVIQNRVVFQPMESCDCNLDGTPSELTTKKYINNVKSGAGIVWFEANAVCAEGRTNHRQMHLTKDNLSVYKDFIKKLRKIALEENGFEPILLLQLTHSGRQSIVPMIAYKNPIYEEKKPITDENIVTDEYLDSLPDMYVESAKLALAAGFDGVDVKSCHGYLFQELLSAYSRKGKYGGSFENRTKLLCDCFSAVRKALPNDFIVASRLGINSIAKPNIKTYWQPMYWLKVPMQEEIKENLKSIELLKEHIINAHVYYWTHGSERQPLKDGVYAWEKYIKLLPENIGFYLEFSKDDSLAQFKQDAAILNTLIGQ